MDADGTAARRADPAGVFDDHELVQSQLGDAVKVLDHAHAVLGPIAQIQLSQSAARALDAAKAERGALGPPGARLDTADQAMLLLWPLFGQAPGTVVFRAQVGYTDPTVHAAWRHHGGRNASWARSAVHVLVITWCRSPQSSPRLQPAVARCRGSTSHSIRR